MKRRLTTLLVGVSLLLSLGLTTYAEEQKVEPRGFVPVFSVTVPTEIPINVDSSGKVVVSSGLQVTNNGERPVSIKGVKINPAVDWKLTTNEDFSAEKVNKKLFTFSIGGNRASETGEISTIGLPDITGGSTLPIAYSASISPQTRSLDEKLASVVLTLDFKPVDNQLTLVSCLDEVGTFKSITMTVSQPYSSPIVWSSSNTDVLEVAGTGLTATLTGRTAGTAIVTATNADGKSVTKSITVKYVPPVEGEVYTDDLYEYKFGYKNDYDSWGHSGLDGWGVKFKDAASKNSSSTPRQPLISINGKNVVDYRCIFMDYKGTSLDLSSWDVSKVESFELVFYNCSSLTSLDVSSWDVSNGTSFFQTFHGCSSLKSLDVSSWNVSRGLDFGSTFSGCSSLTSLDVSLWNVSRGSYFVGTFIDCSSLTSLDVSSWNVSRGSNFTETFYNCSSLTSLDVSSWNVSNGVNFNGTFYNCNNLTSFDLSSWDVSKGVNFTWTFTYCVNITTAYGRTQVDCDKLNASTAKPPNVNFIIKPLNPGDTYEDNLYEYKYAYEYEGGKWQMSQYDGWGVKFKDEASKNSSHEPKQPELTLRGKPVESYSNLFVQCTEHALYLNTWDVTNVKDFTYMFGHCPNLTTLYVQNWNVSNGESFNNMFREFRGIALDVHKWNIQKGKDFRGTFKDCVNLDRLELQNLNAANATSVDEAFMGCKSLKYLDLSGWDLTNAGYMEHFVTDCTSLTTAYAKSQSICNKINSTLYKPPNVNFVVKGKVAQEPEKPVIEPLFEPATGPLW